MQMLAMTESRPGRIVLAPRQDAPFLDSRGRARARMRARRRRILTVALEIFALTAVMGAFPQFRALWVGSGALALFLLLYLGVLLWLRSGAHAQPIARARLETRRLLFVPEMRARLRPAPALAPVDAEDYGLRSVRIVGQ